jgi:hypothetical protein
MCGAGVLSVRIRSLRLSTSRPAPTCRPSFFPEGETPRCEPLAIHRIRASMPTSACSWRVPIRSCRIAGLGRLASSLLRAGVEGAAGGTGQAATAAIAPETAKGARRRPAVVVVPRHPLRLSPISHHAWTRFRAGERCCSRSVAPSQIWGNSARRSNEKTNAERTQTAHAGYPPSRPVVRQRSPSAAGSEGARLLRSHW